MAQSADINGELTAVQFLTPTTQTAATTTYAGVDLRDFIGNCKLILSWTRPNAGGGTCAVSILDSADNTTFTANALTGVITNVGTATSGSASVAIDTRAVKRYVQPEVAISGTTATYTASLVVVGLKQVV
jgi:hypothetical protein